MSTAQQKADRAAYMRSWRASQKERVNAQVRNRRSSIKENDPDEYERRLILSRNRNAKYVANNKDHVAELARKSAAKRRTPEGEKLKREKYKFAYSTKVSIKSARKRAEEKGLPFDLTPEWYEEQFEKGCAVTGMQLDKNGSKTPSTAHVDRVVPELGYVQSNCRLVCACYNLAKKHWTDADVERMARALIAKLDA